MSWWLGWWLVASSFAGVPSVARVGDAPDDGPGVHILVGEAASGAHCGPDAPRPPGAHLDLGLAAPLATREVRQLGGFEVEATVCAADGSCELPSGGTVVVDAVGPDGVRGTYVLVVGGRTVKGEFDAPWCGVPEWSPPARPGVPVEQLPDLTGRQGHSVFARGTLTPGGAALAGPTGATVALRMAPATLEAAARFTGEVEVVAHVDRGALVVDAVRPAR